MNKHRLKAEERPPHITIQPSRGWVSLRTRDLVEYRELIFYLTWRDIKVRYKQTILGALWAILQPLFTMVIFSIFFGKLAGIPSDGLPYPLFCYSGMVIWTFFANGVLGSSNSMVEASNTIKKIYFPRLIIPISSIMSGVIDFALAFTILLVMMAYYGVWPGWNVLWLPLFLLMALISAMGVGFWFSAMNVLFRDVRYAIPFIIQAWLFLTPIAYPTSLLSNGWKIVYGLNPMAGIVDGLRWSLLGVSSKPDSMIIVSAGISVFIFVTGAFYFRRTERVFADVI